MVHYEPNDDRSEAYDALVYLGFPKADALAYLSLMTANRTARQISSICGISRLEAYRALRRLEDAGFVARSGTRPRLYTAASIEETTKILHSKWTSQLESLGKFPSSERISASELVESNRVGLEEIITKEDKPMQGSFAILRGQQPVSAKIIELIDSSKESIDILSW